MKNPGWYQDPSGLYDERYYDGNKWSDEVRNNDDNFKSDEIKKKKDSFKNPLENIFITDERENVDLDKIFDENTHRKKVNFEKDESKIEIKKKKERDLTKKVNFNNSSLESGRNLGVKMKALFIIILLIISTLLYNKIFSLSPTNTDIKKESSVTENENQEEINSVNKNTDQSNENIVDDRLAEEIEIIRKSESLTFTKEVNGLILTQVVNKKGDSIVAYKGSKSYKKGDYLYVNKSLIRDIGDKYYIKALEGSKKNYLKIKYKKSYIGEDILSFILYDGVNFILDIENIMKNGVNIKKDSDFIFFEKEDDWVSIKLRNNKLEYLVDEDSSYEIKFYNLKPSGVLENTYIKEYKTL